MDSHGHPHVYEQYERRRPEFDPREEEEEPEEEDTEDYVEPRRVRKRNVNRHSTNVQVKVPETGVHTGHVEALRDQLSSVHRDLLQKEIREVREAVQQHQLNQRLQSISAIAKQEPQQQVPQPQQPQEQPLPNWAIAVIVVAGLLIVGLLVALLIHSKKQPYVPGYYPYPPSFPSSSSQPSYPSSDYRPLSVVSSGSQPPIQRIHVGTPFAPTHEQAFDLQPMVHTYAPSVPTV